MYKAFRGFEGLCEAPIKRGLCTHTYRHRHILVIFPADMGVLYKDLKALLDFKQLLNGGLCKGPRHFEEPIGVLYNIHTYTYFGFFFPVGMQVLLKVYKAKELYKVPRHLGKPQRGFTQTYIETNANCGLFPRYGGCFMKAQEGALKSL